MFILFKFVLYYIVACCFLFALYEFIKDIFADRIIANGWAETSEYLEYEADEENEEPYMELSYYLDFFIPFINILIFSDLIEMILHTPEQLGVK